MKRDISKAIYVALMILVFGLNQAFGQDSWVRFQVTFDFYAPAESNFFMVSNSYGDTSMYYQPTTPYEVLDTILPVFSGDYTVSLRDNYGDGWTSSLPASFVMGNSCQGNLIDWNPVVGSFFQRDTVITVLPCPPPGPPTPCVQTIVSINLDQYPEETSWDIKDSLGNVLLSGGTYPNVPDYQPQVIVNCLPEGSMTFTIYDQYGDGMAGSLWGGQDGSYYVMQCGDTLVYGSVANFGLDSTHAFISDTCVPAPPVLGCMDYNYLEFDPLANVSDSSCATLKIYGCIDSTMFNYDSLANSMEYIAQCPYELVLYDLVGNGWVGTTLEIYQNNDTTAFALDSGYSETFYLDLCAPAEVSAMLFVSQQAQGTALECGFTLTGPEGIIIEVPVATPGVAFTLYQGFTDCGTTCEEKVYGCMDSIAHNYLDTANVSEPCYYFPGCTSPAYLAYHVDTTSGYFADVNIQDSCLIGGLAVFGCTDFMAFNYNSLANVNNGGCLPVVMGCMDAFALNYNILANTPDSCIPFIYGCTNNIALNYDSLANTDDNSCVLPIPGCMDPLALNFMPQANVDNGSCVDVVYGCTDPTMFNYDQLANVDNGSCIPFTYGCTDSTAFNYNPIANADNSSCVPFIYGCTDPSALNYSTTANTEDFSCIAYVYGCMDSLALNFDSLANTDNGACIEVFVGCMDQAAYNYEPIANTSDSTLCLYNASCIGGPGNPYWLNDPCYAWVILVDEYCCDNQWDLVCQATYDYCNGTWVGPLPLRTSSRELIGITDILGRPAKKNQTGVLFYIYNDNTIERYFRNDK